MTRRPRSASAVAAASPATPPPTTAASNATRSAAQRGHAQPDRRGDQRTPPTRHADHAAEDVVAGGLDPVQDALVNGAHDFGGDERPRVVARQRRAGASVVAARA